MKIYFTLQRRRQDSSLSIESDPLLPDLSDKELCLMGAFVLRELAARHGYDKASELLVKTAILTKPSR